MQKWTTNKPNRTGYWWVKYGGGGIEVVRVEKGAEDLEMYVFTLHSVFPLSINSSFYDWAVWGNSPITEPLGEKI